MPKVQPDYYDKITNPIQYLWHIKRFELITKIMGKIKGKTLDIGCNGGTFTEKIHEANVSEFVIGIDKNKNFIKYGKSKRKFIKFLLSDGRYLPFKNDLFDLITCLEVLEHVPNYEKIIKETHRCLKNNGRFIILIPNEKNLLFKLVWFIWSNFLKGRVWKKTHINDLSKGIIEEVLKSSNFKIIQSKSSHLGMLIAIHSIKI